MREQGLQRFRGVILAMFPLRIFHEVGDGGDGKKTRIRRYKVRSSSSCERQSIHALRIIGVLFNKAAKALIERMDTDHRLRCGGPDAPA